MNERGGLSGPPQLFGGRMARPRKKAVQEPAFVATDKSKWRKVIVADAIHDGAGGFYPLGEMIQAPADVLASLAAKGLIE